MLAAVLVVWAGCGTTKWTDTARTATEQLLISDSMDRAVSQVDFRALAGKKVFLDDGPIKGMTDSAYLVSTLRQHILASGGILKETRDQADYVVEVRAGALGTDRHDVLFGVPALTVPTIIPIPGVPTQIPEIPLLKKTDQRGVAKIALFVYNRHTGRPVWQSGAIGQQSRAKAVWVLGAGPFQRGTIYEGTNFAGDRLNIPLIDLTGQSEGQTSGVAVNDQAFFVEPREPAGPAASPGAADPGSKSNKIDTAAGASPGAAQAVVPAGHAAGDKPARNAPAATGSPALVVPATGAPPADVPGAGTGVWRDRGSSDRVLPFPSISPFDDPPVAPGPAN